MKRGTEEISGSCEHIDSRDVIDRIKYLQDLLERQYENSLEEKRAEEEEAEDETDTEEKKQEVNETEEPDFDQWLKAEAETDSDAEELLKLIALEDDCGSSEWIHGLQLIRDDQFEDHAQELCQDCGYLPKEIPWWIEIDWAKTAKNIQRDYRSVDFDGKIYWYRD